MAQIRETELDVGALARALWRRAWLLVLLAGLAAAGTYYALGFVEPLYTADTSILIEQRESPLTRPREDGQNTTTVFDESAIQSQVEVLRSREIAEAVIDRLDLTRRPQFDPATAPSLIGSLSVLLGIEKHPVEATIRQRVMDSYFERLTVYPVQKSRVITVEFSAPTAALAAEVANAVAEAFADLQQDAKRESAVAATSWLEQEIDRLRERVAESEQEVADYRANNELFDVDSQSGSLSTQQLGDLNAELARARAARAEAEARAQLVEQVLAEGGSLETSQEVLDSALIQRLQERQVALGAQIAELSTTLLPAHPRIRALQGQLADLEGQIRQEGRKVQTSLNTAARVAAAREQSLLASLDDAKVEVSRSGGEEIELRALEREAAAQRGLLESLLARYREALARTDADYLPADARIISRAVAPGEASFPKRTMMATAAGLATFLIASAILMLRQFTSGRAFRVIDYGMMGAPGRWREPGSAALMPVAYSAPEQAFRRSPKAAAVSRRDFTVRDRTADEADVVIVPPAPARALHPAPVSIDQSPAPDATAETASAPEEAPALADAPAVLTAATAPVDAPALSDAAPAAIAAAALASVASTPAGADQPNADRPDTAELSDAFGDDGVRVAVVAGVTGEQGAGKIAFAAGRRAADAHRLVLLDLGATPSDALGGYEQPGLGNLLAGDAAFGEVIQRDEESRVHFIPMGAAGKNVSPHRLRAVIGALTRTYDKVILVANSMQDWPAELQPDLAAIICPPDATEQARSKALAAVLARGAGRALVVRFGGEPADADRPQQTSEAA